MIKPWKTLTTKLLENVPIFGILQVTRKPPDGEPVDFWVMELPDWANVVALTDDDQLVLVRQYRHGTDEVTLEIPGGNVDEGESAEEAARRELLEETGFGADHWEQIGNVEPNPAFMGNQCATYLARGARKVQEPQPDEYEDLEVVLVDRADFDTLIARGDITHSLVVAAAYHLQQWEKT